MKNFKRIFSSILAVILLLGMITIPSFAAPTMIILDDTTASGDGWSWNADSKTLELNNYTGGGFEYSGGITDDEFTIIVKGTNTIDLDDRYNLKDVFVFEYKSIEVTGGGVINMYDAEYGFWARNITFKNVTVNAEGLYNFASAYDIVAEDTIFNLDDIAYGFVYGDVSMTNCKVNFVADELVDYETFNDLISDDYPDVVYWAHLFDNSHVSDYRNDGVEYDDAILMDEYVTDINLVNCDMSYKVSSADVEKPFDEGYFFSDNYDAAKYNRKIDNCRIYLENGDGIDSPSYVGFADYNIDIVNGSVFELKNICDFTYDDLNISDSTVTGIISGYFADGESTIVKNSVIDVECKNTLDYWYSYGFSGSNVTIENSKVKIVVQDAAISCKNFNLKESEVYFKSVESMNEVLDEIVLDYADPTIWQCNIGETPVSKAVAEITRADITNSAVFEIKHVHKVSPVSGKEATYAKDGWKGHYKCVCGELFEDADCKKPIADLEAWKKGEGKLNALGFVDTSKVFKDVKSGKWYGDAIDYCYTYYFISGVANDEFGVNVAVTRGMFITILARIAGVDTGKEANNVGTKFADVKSGKYYTAAIKWASDNKIVSGLSDTTFGPDTAIERQQLCTMIVNFAKHQGITITEVEAAIDFVDNASIAKYAKDAVAICQKADIVNGYAVNGGFEFRPKNTATRAEAAQILYKFHKDFVAK